MKPGDLIMSKLGTVLIYPSHDSLHWTPSNGRLLSNEMALILEIENNRMMPIESSCKILTSISKTIGWLPMFSILSLHIP